MSTGRRIALLVTAETTATTFYPGYPAFLKSRGWDVSVIADSQGRLESSTGLKGAKIHAVAMKRDPHPIADLVSLWTLTKTLRRISPDVLVFATPKASLLGAISGYLLKIPVRSYQLWGLRLETEVGIRRQVFLGLEKLTSKLATEVVANSRSLGAMASELGSTNGKSVSVIGAGSGLGVDLEHYSQLASVPEADQKTRTLLKEESGFVIGFVGRLNRDKGLGTLLTAAGALARKRPGVKLLIIGGQDGVDLDEMLRETDPGLKIHVVGAVDDVRPYYRLMDVNCLPTLREGFPNVVLEAAGMGLPTVTTDATGAKDSVIPGKTGYIVPVGDAAELETALMRLYDSAALRAEMGLAARGFVEQFYDRRTVWDLHERHLRSELEKADRSRKPCPTESAIKD